MEVAKPIPTPEDTLLTSAELPSDALQPLEIETPLEGLEVKTPSEKLPEVTKAAPPPLDLEEVKVIEEKTGDLKEDTLDVEDFSFFHDLDVDIMEAQRDQQRGRWKWIAAASGFTISTFVFVLWFFFYILKLHKS